MTKITRTGGRAATTGVIPGRYALSVGHPGSPPPAGWTWRQLAEVARLESGHTPSRRRPEYWDGDVPWIGIRDATENHGGVIHDTRQHISELGLAHSSARLLPADTVCLSRTASIGYVVVMGRPMATSQDFVNWVCGVEIDPRFLRYVLVAEHSSMAQFAHGTTHQTIYYPEAKAFHICLPSIEEQRAIGRLLELFDDKIELNSRTCRTLEQIAEAIFRVRFIDFGLDGAIEPAIGRIPTGWRVGSLSDVATVTMGQSPPSSTYTSDPDVGTLLVQGMGGFGRRFPRSTTYCSAPGKRARAGDLLITVRAPVGELNICDRDTCLGRGVAGIASSTPGFVEMSLRSGAHLWEELAGGTIFSAVNGGQVRRFPILVPPASCIEDFEGLYTPLRAKLLALHRESETLAALRNLLLPKLISGEIRIRAEEPATT